MEGASILGLRRLRALLSEAIHQVRRYRGLAATARLSSPGRPLRALAPKPLWGRSLMVAPLKGARSRRRVGFARREDEDAQRQPSSLGGVYRRDGELD